MRESGTSIDVYVYPSGYVAQCGGACDFYSFHPDIVEAERASLQHAIDVHGPVCSGSFRWSQNAQCELCSYWLGDAEPFGHESGFVLPVHKARIESEGDSYVLAAASDWTPE